MFLSIPALKEVVIEAISKKTNLPRESVKQVLESDGPWTDHDRFLTNTFMSAKQRAEDLGVDLEVSAEGGASFESAERLEEVSKETGQPLETIEAINQAYFEFIDNVTQMMKKKLGGEDAP